MGRQGCARGAADRDRAIPAANRTRGCDALALISQLHSADRRQREPYANHLLRVTVRILSLYRITNPEVACAALLYDSVEDHAEDITPCVTRHAALAMLTKQFGERTAELVTAVTLNDHGKWKIAANSTTPRTGSRQSATTSPGGSQTERNRSDRRGDHQVR